MAVWAGFKGWRWFQLKFGTTWGSYDWYEWDENIISITRTPGGWVAGAPLTLTEVEDKLYCKRCWKHYGWYIKNGPPYTLSLHLDRLARKHGVRIVEVNVGKGKAKGKGFLSQTLGWLMGKYGKVRSQGNRLDHCGHLWRERPGRFLKVYSQHSSRSFVLGTSNLWTFLANRLWMFWQFRMFHIAGFINT